MFLPLDPSLILPTLVEPSNFGEQVSGGSTYYVGTSSANQNAFWLAPIPSASCSHTDMTNPTDFYRSHLPDQMHLRWETQNDPNPSYYTPVLEPVEFSCGDQMVNSHEEYGKSKLSHKK